MPGSDEISPLNTYGERLRRAGEAVGQARQAHEDAIALRDRVVLEAIDDAGLSIAQVARLALLSPARVVQIVAKAG